MTLEAGTYRPAPRPMRSGPPGLADRVAAFGAVFVRQGAALGVHLLVLAVWQAAAMSQLLPDYILPSPLDTLRSLAVPEYDWLSNALATAIEIYAGFLAAVVFGVTAALLFSWSRWSYLLIMPLLMTLNMIPKVAVGPIIVVWFSYGITTNILIAFAIAFFPIVITTARGLREIEPELIDLLKTLRASRWDIFRKIQFPGALPYVFSGMKVAAVLAVAGALVGEFIASKEGLGYLMLQVQISLDTAAMFMAVIVITLLGVLLYGAVAGLERLYLKGRPGA